MPRFLLVTDAAWVTGQVSAALNQSGSEVVVIADPSEVVAAVHGGEFYAAIVDLQVASMGGMAITRALREASHLGDAPRLGTVMLLDRQADAFLARRAGADAWVKKPFDAVTLRDAVAEAQRLALEEEAEAR